MLIKNLGESKGIVGHKLPDFVEKKKVKKKKLNRALDLSKQLTQALKIIDELEVEREERFKEGFALGKDEGYKDGLGQIDSKIQQVAETVAVIKKHQHEYIRSAEDFIVDFSIKMVEEMVGSGVLEQQKISVEKITEFVNSTLDNFADSTKYIFQVHKETLPVMQEYLDKIKDCFKEKTIVSVVEEPSLAPGDCFVETDFGALDGKIKTHFREILNAVTGEQD